MSGGVSGLTAVGVDIFAGGFTLGVEQHFRVLAHLEHGPYGVATFRRNRPWVPVHHPKDRWPVDRLRPDFVYANPPCAIVSVAGKSLRNGVDSWKTDPRTDCIRDAVTAAIAMETKAFACESVIQLYTRARELVDEQSQRLNDAGYAVTHLLVNTGWHGVPQLRKRYFLVAHRGGLQFQRPNYAPPMTVREVLREVDQPGWYPPEDRLKVIYDQLQPKQGPREVWEKSNPPETWVRSRTGVQGRPRMMEYRLPLDEPMGVFYGDFFVHPTEPRRLGIEEAKALCGFPASFEFGCPPSHAYSELARGVMPSMGEWLARQVKNSLESRVWNEQPEASRVVDLRKPEELAA